MKKNVIKEINDMKYLLTYNRGRLLSEQEKYEGEDIDIKDTEIDDFDDEDEDEDFNYLKGEMEEEFDIDMDDYSDELPSFDSEGMFKGMSNPNGDMDTRTPEEREIDMRDIDMELDEEMDFPVMSPGTKEKERTITTPGIKPGKKTGTPYSPKPGPKKNPKAKSDKMPDWLSFDELGIEFE